MADMFLDTSVEAFSKFTRRRTDGPVRGFRSVQKVQKQKIKLCLPILPESSGIFQRPGSYRPEYEVLFYEHKIKQ